MTNFYHADCRISAPSKKSNSDRPFNPKNHDRHFKKLNSDRPFITQNHDHHFKKLNSDRPLNSPKTHDRPNQKSNSDRPTTSKVTIAFLPKNQTAIATQKKSRSPLTQNINQRPIFRNFFIKPYKIVLFY